MCDNVSFKIKSNTSLPTHINELLKNQEHTCYICNDAIILKEQDILCTPCNHIYHYECIYYTLYKNSLNPHKRYKIRSILECPYCRTYIESSLPRFKTHIYPSIPLVTEIYSKCDVILKSGKKKGQKCGCKTKYNSIFCGRHKNCVERTEKDDEFYFIST